jgi:hypothetical protein
MANKGIQSRTADYQRALEGVGYATSILKNKQTQLEEIITNLNNPEVMDGETGKEYTKKIIAVSGTVNALLEKFGLFANKVEEVCKANGAYLDNSVMADMSKVEAAFRQTAEDIKSFNGKTSKNA